MSITTTLSPNQVGGFTPSTQSSNDIQTEFRNAFLKGDLSLAESYIGQGAAINKETPPLLIQVVLSEDGLTEKQKKIRFLLDRGVDINTIDMEGKTALHYAAENGEMTLIPWLIQNKRANPNIQDNLGNTPFHCVVKSLKFSQSAPNYWFGFGGALDVPNNKGETPLLIACQIGDDRMAQALVEKDCSPFKVSEKGSSPLLEAIKKSIPEDPEFLTNKQTQVAGNFNRIVSIMIQNMNENEANQNIGLGLTPLLAIVRYAKPNDENSASLADLSIRKGANVDAKGPFGNTSLHYASLKGDLTLIGTLLRKNADPEILNDQSRKPLHLAAYREHDAAVQALYDWGAEIPESLVDLICELEPGAGESTKLSRCILRELGYPNPEPETASEGL